MAQSAKAPQQTTFIWEGADKKGSRVKGESQGPSAALVKADLRRQGINPLKVRKKPKALFGAGKKKITSKEIAIFSRQMATMMSSGVPLVQSFDIVGKGHENPSMAEMIMAIKASVEAGGTFTEALRQHPLQFDELYCSLVHAGEQAGILEKLLNEIANYKEKTEAIKAKVKKALFYPVSIIVVAFVITAILMIFVIPQFESLFKGFGADLPALTQMVINISAIFQEWWWAIFGGIGGFIYGFINIKKRSTKVQHAMDRLALKAPVFGDIVLKSTIARFARTMATMFAAGVPLVEAMESVAGASGNAVYYDGIMKMRDEVATGTQLNISMRNSNLFPNMVNQMVAIGEEAGSVDAMLSKVADFYEEEVDNAVDAMASLMEPLIMAVLGVLIGGLVIAMYLPIFKMGEVV